MNVWEEAHRIIDGLPRGQTKLYPVHFMGQDTGRRAPSKAAAARAALKWLQEGHGPEIPAAYKPVMPRHSKWPTLGRLRSNTDFTATPQGVGHFSVGLGLPARNRAKTNA